MTTLVLQAANTALSTVASSATAWLGGALANAIGGTGSRATIRSVEGPRLAEMHGLASTEGAPIPRLYGRARLGGQLIWATRFEEVAATSVERQTSRGGKSLGGTRRASTTTVTTSYSYYANLAVALCEGPIAFVRRIWADGREIDRTQVAMRVHGGGEDEPPDPLIVAKEGADNAPAYRGTAYVVFERLALAPFGNRVPQFSFEVVRPVDGLRQMVRSVCLIPGASEFGYDPAPVRRTLGLGASAPENTHQFQRATDVLASLDWLQALCPNVRHVSLVLSWFGDDLRAGACQIGPRVELADKATSGSQWIVAGQIRGLVPEVSRVAGLPAYGGTPSDDGVLRLIAELKRRGLAVTLYPFLMMDVPAGNGRPDPRAPGAEQPPYPWRGRITCDPAPGLPGSPDGTAAAATQVAAFFAGFRQLVHHYAGIAQQAGGVDGFVIGSELVGLTRIRSAPGVYPAVAALRSLAGEVRAILPDARLTYAADWTEYGAHVLAGGQEVRFPLDPLWADPAIDAVGIDWYPPISDWRDGPTNADAALGRSSHDPDYLRARLGGGEAFDWYYASPADRLAQVRTPITDGAYGKPWIFRAKDLVGWWENPHVERVGGIEIGATPWVPSGKPIWLTETGIPAVDKGPNGPNVFPDPKSAESAAPPFSRGARDDLAQIRGLEAMLSRFDPALPGHQAAFNPVSAVYGGRMVDPGRISVWAWDARPFPAFPDFDTVWADGANWQAGHWITGRLEGAPLDRLVPAVMAESGLAAGPAPLDGFVDGYLLDRPISARGALEPLGDLFGFDLVAGDGIRWRGRGGAVDLALSGPDLVETDKEPVVARSRSQETDLPAAVTLGFTDGEGEYARASARSRRLAGGSRRESAIDVAVVTRRAEAQRLADLQLQDAWAGRETVEVALSPRAVAVEPGDVVTLDGTGPFRVARIAAGPTRRLSFQAVEPVSFKAEAPDLPALRRRAAPSVAGAPSVLVLDLPPPTTGVAALQYLAVAADPWPGAVAIWRSVDGGASFAPHATAAIPAVIGRTLTPLAAGPVWVADRATTLDVELSQPALSAIGEAEALAGGNLFALGGSDGAWEVLSAADAVLIGPRRYRLSRLYRGLGGTEAEASRSVPAGAAIVRLDEGVVPIATAASDLGATFLYRVGPDSATMPTRATWPSRPRSAPAPCGLSLRSGPPPVGMPTASASPGYAGRARTATAGRRSTPLSARIARPTRSTCSARAARCSARSPPRSLRCFTPRPVRSPISARRSPRSWSVSPR